MIVPLPRATKPGTTGAGNDSVELFDVQTSQVLQIETGVGDDQLKAKQVLARSGLYDGYSGVNTLEDLGSPVFPLTVKSFHVAANMAVVRNGHEWLIDKNRDGYLAEKSLGFGLPGDRHFSADLNGDGIEELVIARENRSRGGIDWYIDDAGDGNSAERVLQFGLLGDLPLIGDFDANGRDDLAVARWVAARGTYEVYLDLKGDGWLAERVLHYGLDSDTILVGDSNGDGRDELIAVRQNSRTGGLDWYFDLLGNGGSAERVSSFGLLGDIVLMGDFDGNRRDDMIAVRKNYNRGGLDWYFDLLGNGGAAEKKYEYGLMGDTPVIGDFRR